MPKLRTHEEARAWLSYLGISATQWAREHKFSEGLVLEVLAGRRKCLRGQSHNIAVALGMKHGVATTRPGRMPASDAAVQRTAGTAREILRAAT